MISLGELNAPCPYCQLSCRLGMIHFCAGAPRGASDVKILKRDGQVIAYVFGRE